KGLAVHVLHVADDDLLIPTAKRTVVRPDALATEFSTMAASFAGGEGSAIFLGHYAQQHPECATLLAIAQDLGRKTGAIVGVFPDGANAVGAHLAGAVPKAGGLDARAMIATPRRAYLVAGTEVEHDLGPQAVAALAQSEFNVVLSAYRNAATEHAHVILPVTPFTETGGTFVNMEGRVQSFNAVVKPAGDSRPGWKVLRILGSMLEIPHFHPDTLEAVRAQIAPDLQAWATAGLDNAIATFSYELRAPGNGLERVAEFAVTASDPIVRRSPALQRSADGKASRAARLNAATLAKLGLAAGDKVRVKQGGGEATLVAVLDAALPDNVVRVARGVVETAALGDGAIVLEKIRETVAA
ncbi:MAG TPA: molybdopterin-dependent oxidoreductase, partial [Usitatibacter sp.]